MTIRFNNRRHRRTTLAALGFVTALAAGCSSSDDNGTGTLTGIDTDPTIDMGSDTGVDPGTGMDTNTDDTTTDTTTQVLGNFNSALFGDALQRVEQVDCTLDSGTNTTCMQLTFLSNAVGDTEGNGTVGPYCPESTATPRNEAGFGVYDGPTTPGFQSLVDAAIAMDADGFDIVNDDGSINVSDLSTQGEEGLSFCLEAPFADAVELSFIIPIEPEFRATPHQVGTVESVGVAVSGVPYKGFTPSVTTVEEGVGGTGSGNIPALDHCGGHPDPAGYYHWHLVPQGTNTVLASEAFNFTQDFGITCSNVNVDFDSPSNFAGLTRDGFPLYGPFDEVDGADTQPADVATLDECNGHQHPTAEFPDGVFHYHALQDTAPNIPPCLMGSFVEQDFLVDGQGGGGGAGGPPR